jgi:hypothetical protein
MVVLAQRVRWLDVPVITAVVYSIRGDGIALRTQYVCLST